MTLQRQQAKSTVADSEYIVSSDQLDFTPDGQNTKVLRNALGRFATGVTIITVVTEHGPVGMTVNSFSSVSLDPALIQWSVAKQAGRYEPFTVAAEFTVNVLRAEHAQTALDFARDASDFDPRLWLLNDTDPPQIKDALATFNCSKHSLVDGGDHTIIIGTVKNGNYSDTEGSPLLFYKGQFGHFSGFD